jgi:hypothetical protein
MVPYVLRDCLSRFPTGATTVRYSLSVFYWTSTVHLCLSLSKVQGPVLCNYLSSGSYRGQYCSFVSFGLLLRPALCNPPRPRFLIEASTIQLPHLWFLPGSVLYICLFLFPIAASTVQFPQPPFPLYPGFLLRTVLCNGSSRFQLGFALLKCNTLFLQLAPLVSSSELVLSRYHQIYTGQCSLKDIFRSIMGLIPLGRS